MNSSMKESECILPPIHSVRRCGRTFHCSFLFLVALLFMGSRTAFNAKCVLFKHAIFIGRLPPKYELLVIFSCSFSLSLGDSLSQVLLGVFYK